MFVDDQDERPTFRQINGRRDGLHLSTPRRPIADANCKTFTVT